MTKVISLSDFKRRKGMVTIPEYEPEPVELQEVQLRERLERIKSSIERVNKLIEELKGVKK